MPWAQKGKVDYFRAISYARAYLYMRDGFNTTTAQNPKPPSTLKIPDATYPSSCSSLDIAIAPDRGWPGYANAGTSHLDAYVGNE
jgi:hypothetical protein